MKRNDIEVLEYKLSSAGIVFPDNVEIAIHVSPDEFYEMAAEFNVRVPNGGPMFKNDQFRHKSRCGYIFKIKISKEVEQLKSFE